MHFSLVLFVVSDKGIHILELMGENLAVDVDPESLKKQSLNISKTPVSLERSTLSSSDSANSSSSTHSLRTLSLLIRAGEVDWSDSCIAKLARVFTAL